MSIRLLIHSYLIFIMLKYAIAHLQHVETDFNRREAMVRTVINAQKQAKTSERIRFLLECKRAELCPTSEDPFKFMHAFLPENCICLAFEMFILKTVHTEIYKCYFFRYI